MRTFDFRCPKCGLVIDVDVESGKDFPIVKCGTCFVEMKRIFSTYTVMMKGGTTTNPREKKEPKKRHDISADLERRLR